MGVSILREPLDNCLGSSSILRHQIAVVIRFLQFLIYHQRDSAPHVSNILLSFLFKLLINSSFHEFTRVKLLVSTCKYD